MSLPALRLLLSLSTIGAGISVAQYPPVPDGCRYIPSDPRWPSTQQWAMLNETVGGRLIATRPAGAPCYKSTYNVKTGDYDISTYDQNACANVQKSWHETSFHEESSSSIMQTYFANNSCNPIADQSGDKCGIGSYVQYAIDVTGDADVRAGLAFAQKNNIRLLIRNTGHEYVHFPGLLYALLQTIF